MVIHDSMSKEDVRILLVGEVGVGKTSLILSLVSEMFPDEVPAKAEEITIPADVTPERVPTHIVDFTFQEQNEDDLQWEIGRANVICIVYAIDDESTIVRIEEYWMPFIHDTLGTGRKVPVILVGNKSDTQDGSTMERILPIMNEYSEIETCVECSAKTLKNISEMFYYAQKAVLHPTAPLYIPEERGLTEKCRDALIRVFKICDMDNDGILNDRELNNFQKRCFNAPLQSQALDEVKTVVRKTIGDGIQNDGLTQNGFLFLHTLFIQRGRHETTWTVLRKFGYDNNVELTNEYLCPNVQVHTGATTELSENGVRFLNVIFSKYDKDKDGCLSSLEVKNLFSTCPHMPWGPDVSNAVCSNEQGWINHKGYICQWMLTTLLDVNRTLEYLGHLGYRYLNEREDQSSAILVTRDRRHDILQRQSLRNVFQCNVIGAKGSGKTAFLQGHLGRNMKYVATLNRDNLPVYTINTVQVYGHEKYLLLHEIDVQLAEKLSSAELTCDVVCLIYDVTNSSSFEYCARMYKKHFHDRQVPCLIVGAKSEQIKVKQDSELQPDEFCKRYRLPSPQSFHCMDQISKDVYHKLTTMAAFPNLRDGISTNSNILLKASIGIAVIAGISFILYKYKTTKS